MKMERTWEFLDELCDPLIGAVLSMLSIERDGKLSGDLAEVWRRCQASEYQALQPGGPHPYCKEAEALLAGRSYLVGSIVHIA